MTEIVVRVAETYKELRDSISKARSSGLEGTESYKKLIDTLDDLALALHRMLYVDEKLDLETERVVSEALKPRFNEIN